MSDAGVSNPDPLSRHYLPRDISDRVAFRLTKFLRFLADTFFAKRYGHRAIILETVAGVPGMVGGMLRHMRSLRRLEPDEGWIHTLLAEAENERMHLMTFIEIAHPNWFERVLILVAQGVFFFSFLLLYVCSSRTAHRLVGYFEEEAVYSYTEYLQEIDRGAQPNVPAPQVAIDYWNLPADARLRDVVIAVRADEAGHRDVNHAFADELAGRKQSSEAPREKAGSSVDRPASHSRYP
ncbi:MAG: oxidase [Gammaproteobacteria bacterium]|nr:MAG: oxidase [Gammaproteobacteria bacterium]